MIRAGDPDAPVQRQFLAAQVAARLRDGIAARRWGEWLPTERDLAAALHVSRSTLRAALKSLQQDGAIESIRARGNRITTPTNGRRRAVAKSVGLIAPGPLHLHAPFAHVWLDHLRAELHDHGLGIVVHENAHVYAQTRRSSALELLVDRNPHACWVPVLSTPAMQAWFVRRGVPCILAGSPQRGIELPSVDVDFLAACRHAALRLLQLGHRRIVFINEQSRARGYGISEMGFFKGVADFGDARAEVTVRRVRPDERLTAAQLQPLWQRRPAPTAVVVMTAGRCLGVSGALGQLGLSIPRDVSLVCRSAGSFFEHMVPGPAHYDFRPEEYAAVIARHALAHAQGAAPPAGTHLLMPKFVRGESLAAPMTREV